ncbi:MAG: ArsR/SmtB family transcription factor [bacterium]
MVNKTDPVFSALADQNRRRVIEVLMTGPERASDIAQKIGLARNATTRHLNLLRKTGVVGVEIPDSDARSRIYHLEIEHLASARQWLEQVEDNWRLQLRRFKEFAETSRDE